MDDKKKKKNNSPAWVIVVLLLMFLRAMDDGDMTVLPIIIIGLSIVAVIWIIMASIKKSNTRGGEKPQYPLSSQPAVREKPRRPQQERAGFPQRRETYTPDNGNRYIAQLNGFLKNGIIDAKEYKIMLERYKRNGNI